MLTHLRGLFILFLLAAVAAGCLTTADSQSLGQGSTPSAEATASTTSSERDRVKSQPDRGRIYNDAGAIAKRNADPDEHAHANSSTPTPLRCWKQGGRIEQHELRSELLTLPLEFRVYLPPCYDQQPERTYPVLYLIHGQSYNDDQWDRLGADEAADALIAAEQTAPFLIVMPRDRVWSQPTEDKFGEAVVQDLLPWIDAHYRTRAERAYRAVGGLSRGAGWAVHLGFSQWEYFSAIGAHSLPVFWTDLPHLREWMELHPGGRHAAHLPGPGR